MEGQIRTPDLAFLIVCYPFVTGTRHPSAARSDRWRHENGVLCLTSRDIVRGVWLAEEDRDIEDYFPLPKQVVGDGELFLLKVVGDSMNQCRDHGR